MDKKSLIKEIENLRKSKVIVYFLGLNSTIAQDAVEIIYNNLRRIGKVEKIDLFLHTTGGFLEVPLKIVNIIREFTNKFSVLVPYRAHSAGTLLALGADEIVMGKMAELTPVDPQTRSPLNPKGLKGELLPVSIQDLTSFFDFLESKGIKEKKEIMNTLLSNLHPLVIGSVNRSLYLIKHTMERLLIYSSYSEEEKNKIIELLSCGLPSHTYLITRNEAKDILKDKVVFSDENLDLLMWNLYQVYMASLDPRVPYVLDANLKKEVKRVNIAFIETLDYGSAFIQTFEKTFSPDGKIIETPIFGGWFDIK
ncbi:MAG: SDH family Clp fold serine proteinase [Caldisericia bacterium]